MRIWIGLLMTVHLDESRGVRYQNDRHESCRNTAILQTGRRDRLAGGAVALTGAAWPLARAVPRQGRVSAAGGATGAVARGHPGALRGCSQGLVQNCAIKNLHGTGKDSEMSINEIRNGQVIRTEAIEAAQGSVK